MCGIVGILEAPAARADRGVLSRMTDSLAHRGPDGRGLHLEGRLGLGHRRLSIIDLEGGAQPMFSEDASVTVVHNGEIYNFRELRNQLEKKGHRFRTRSDTEVIVYAYREWGAECLSRLDGMFAFAAWDGRRRRLLLARDRFGKKPLYWARCEDGALLFASEPKAFRYHPSFQARVDPHGLADYLMYESVPAPRSIYAGVHKLPAASYVEIDVESDDMPARVPAPERYWQLRFDVPAVAGHPRLRAAELQSHFWELLRQAVAKRLVADVPLGVFLSGGLDSSAIVTALAEVVSPGQIRTFCIGFDDPSFDESTHARRVARHIGTQHEEAVLSAAAAHEALPEVAALLDEPLGDASILPTYLLSRFTRENVTVALGGDGGDELLSGYPTFYADTVARAARRLPGGVLRALRRAARLLPVSHDNFSFDFKVKQFLKGAARDDDERHAVWLGSFDPVERAAVLAPDLAREAARDDPFGPARRVLQEVRSHARDREDELCAYYLALYLGSDVLTKVDRASMAVALEVRAPLLDTRLAEFAARLPARLKRRGRTTKLLLRNTLEGKLPASILSRPKKGFGIPVARWLRGPWREMLQDLLAPAKIRREGLLDPVTVQRLLREHQDGVRDHGKPLYTLMMLELWLERFGPQAVFRDVTAAA